MAIRTENLTILFVDIAGYTATTNRQSRAENAALLHTFDRTMLPLIKRFKGRVVKSIGDALLLTFRSPTDAMLCAMAMQDAMHDNNLRAKDDEKIHIRVAANLGEVRVTPKDIFGEPVNVAARIEGIAPADEIYLSEAVFMAMNKAEVPAQEVGFKELAGMPQAIRVYSIPRFATHRLIPQNAVPDQGGELLFPYGGMHQRLPNGSSAGEQFGSSNFGKYAAGVVALVAVAAGTMWAAQGFKSQSATAPTVTNPISTPQPAANAANVKTSPSSPTANATVPSPNPLKQPAQPASPASAAPVAVVAAEAARPEVGKFVKAYENNSSSVKVWTVRVGPPAKNEALVQITGIDHPWDMKIFKANVITDSQQSEKYRITHNGQPFVMLIVSEHGAEVYLPDNKIHKVAYSKILAEQGNPEHFLTDYLNQKTR
jgi:class 3 adenylate cyclase